MKICQFTLHDLEARARLKGDARFGLHRTPMQVDLGVLSAALEVVNQAGLDGKKLTDLTVVYTASYASMHSDDQVFEIHAKVTHRLKTD